MAATRIVATAGLLPALLAAQGASARRHVEVVASATYWHLDGGTVSSSGTSVWGPSVQIGFGVLEGQVVYAPAKQGGDNPGLAGAELGLHLRTRAPDAVPKPEVHFTLGVATLYFDARAREAALRDCTPATFCMFEGISYHTGWRTVAVIGVAPQIPVGRSLRIEIGPDVVLPMHGLGGSEGDGYLRLRFGIAWRP